MISAIVTAIYSLKAARVPSADAFAPAFKAALDSGEPYLLDVPMENIAVPTPGCRNINGIYKPNDRVSEGKRVKKENK